MRAGGDCGQADLMSRTYAELPGLMTQMTGDEKHGPSATSTLDVLWVLYDQVLWVSPDTVEDPGRDRFLLSKGHRAGRPTTRCSRPRGSSLSRGWRGSVRRPRGSVTTRTATGSARATADGRFGYEVRDVLFLPADEALDHNRGSYPQG